MTAAAAPAPRSCPKSQPAPRRPVRQAALEGEAARALQVAAAANSPESLDDGQQQPQPRERKERAAPPACLSAAKLASRRSRAGPPGRSSTSMKLRAAPAPFEWAGQTGDGGGGPFRQSEKEGELPGGGLSGPSDKRGRGRRRHLLLPLRGISRRPGVSQLRSGGGGCAPGNVASRRAPCLPTRSAGRLPRPAVDARPSSASPPRERAEAAKWRVFANAALSGHSPCGMPRVWAAGAGGGVRLRLQPSGLLPTFRPFLLSPDSERCLSREGDPRFESKGTGPVGAV